MLPERGDVQLSLIYIYNFDTLLRIVVTAEQELGPGRNNIDKPSVLEEKKRKFRGIIG
jgi:hypothetical protein